MVGHWAVLAAQLFAASNPNRVTKLMLIASTPRFTVSKHWSYGMNKKSFIDFKNQFEHMPFQTLKKFSTLQIFNAENSKSTLPILNKSLSDQDRHINGIKWGLQWLQDVDLRNNKNFFKIVKLICYMVKMTMSSQSMLLSKRLTFGSKLAY